MKTTSTKAHFASVSSLLGLIVAFYMQKWIPWWAEMPAEVQAAHIVLVVGGMSWAITHYSPSNKPVLDLSHPLVRPEPSPATPEQ